MRANCDHEAAIRKGHVDWQRFLYSIPARDYIFQKTPYEEQIREADCVIIRLPFEKMTRENRNITLIRMNLDEAVVPASLGERAIGINADMAKSVEDLCGSLN